MQFRQPRHLTSVRIGLRRRCRIPGPAPIGRARLSREGVPPRGTIGAVESSGLACLNEREASALRHHRDVDSDRIGDQWRSLRDALDKRAIQAKDSMQAIFELNDAYGRLDETERSEVNKVLVEWLLSDDAGLRYDAEFIVEKHSLRKAVPALRTLQDRLENESSEPGAPYEWAKVNRILGGLASD